MDLKKTFASGFGPTACVPNEEGWRTLELAFLTAGLHWHAFVHTEHLLIALTLQEKSVVVKALVSLGFDLKSVRAAMEEHLGEGSQSKDTDTRKLTARAMEVLSLAAATARQSGQRNIGPEHIFFALIQEKRGFAGWFLRKTTNLERVRQALRDGVVDAPDLSLRIALEATALDILACLALAEKDEISPATAAALIGVRDTIWEKVIKSKDKHSLIAYLKDRLQEQPLGSLKAELFGRVLNLLTEKPVVISIDYLTTSTTCST